MAKAIPSVKLPNGRNMPIIGLGTYKAGEGDIKVLIDTALECGYRHIDTAALYENEGELGDALQPWLSNGKITREELFVTTKLPQIGNREADVSRFLDHSLKRLKLSYVDLYLIHNPAGFIGKNDDDVWPTDSEGKAALDMNTNLEELYKAMEEQVDLGKAKAIGISNFNSKQVERIMKICRIKPSNNQVELHAYHQQKPLREVCAKYGIPVCAFAPIAAPYKKSTGSGDTPILLENPTVKSIADRLKKTPAQILIRFLLQQGIIVIPKSANPGRIKQNIQVFDFELSQSDMSALDAVDQGRDGKLFIFEDAFKGITRHPEYPFHIPF